MMPSKLRAGLFAVGMCGCMSATTLGQTNSAFYDRATSTIRQVFDDPLRCVPAEHVKQKWVEWSKCVASDRTSCSEDCARAVHIAAAALLARLGQAFD